MKGRPHQLRLFHIQDSATTDGALSCKKCRHFEARNCQICAEKTLHELHYAPPHITELVDIAVDTLRDAADCAEDAPPPLEILHDLTPRLRQILRDVERIISTRDRMDLL